MYVCPSLCWKSEQILRCIGYAIIPQVGILILEYSCTSATICIRILQLQSYSMLSLAQCICTAAVALNSQQLRQHVEHWPRHTCFSITYTGLYYSIYMYEGIRWENVFWTHKPQSHMAPLWCTLQTRSGFSYPNPENPVWFLTNSNYDWLTN